MAPSKAHVQTIMEIYLHYMNNGNIPLPSTLPLTLSTGIIYSGKKEPWTLAWLKWFNLVPKNPRAMDLLGACKLPVPITSGNKSICHVLRSFPPEGKKIEWKLPGELTAQQQKQVEMDKQVLTRARAIFLHNNTAAIPILDQPSIASTTPPPPSILTPNTTIYVPVNPRIVTPPFPTTARITTTTTTTSSCTLLPQEVPTTTAAATTSARGTSIIHPLAKKEREMDAAAALIMVRRSHVVSDQDSSVSSDDASTVSCCSSSLLLEGEEPSSSSSLPGRVNGPITNTKTQTTRKRKSSTANDLLCSSSTEPQTTATSYNHAYPPSVYQLVAKVTEDFRQQQQQLQCEHQRKRQRQ